MSDHGDVPGTDQAMLLALMNRGRDKAPLSADQERLLNDWMAGDLPAADVSRAEALAKNNVFAAEHILEHRLMAAASHEPPVPAGLTARILRMDRPPTPKRYGFRWPALRPWQWSALVGAIAAAVTVVVVGLQQFTPPQSGMRVQLAMATVSDRSVLFEASDVRMRGARQSVTADQRFRDIEVPDKILEQLIEAVGTGAKSSAAQSILPFLVNAKEDGGTNLNVIVDAALSQKVTAAGDRKQLSVRVYDLDDARSADVPQQVRAAATGWPDLLSDC